MHSFVLSPGRGIERLRDKIQREPRVANAPMMTRNAMGVSSFPAPKMDRGAPRGGARSRIRSRARSRVRPRARSRVRSRARSRVRSRARPRYRASGRR